MKQNDPRGTVKEKTGEEAREARTRANREVIEAACEANRSKVEEDVHREHGA